MEVSTTESFPIARIIAKYLVDINQYYDTQFICRLFAKEVVRCNIQTQAESSFYVATYSDDCWEDEDNERKKIVTNKTKYKLLYIEGTLQMSFSCLNGHRTDIDIKNFQINCKNSLNLFVCTVDGKNYPFNLDIPKDTIVAINFADPDGFNMEYSFHQQTLYIDTGRMKSTYNVSRKSGYMIFTKFYRKMSSYVKAYL